MSVVYVKLQEAGAETLKFLFMFLLWWGRHDGGLIFIVPEGWVWKWPEGMCFHTALHKLNRYRLLLHTDYLHHYHTMRRTNENARRKNGTLRNKHRARFKALGLPCAICGGDIHYWEPSDSTHPLSFVIDEKLPVSRWREFGYSSAAAAAQDWNNLQPAHYICNQRKGNRTMREMKTKKIIPPPPDSVENHYSIMPDGDW